MNASNSRISRRGFLSRSSQVALGISSAAAGLSSLADFGHAAKKKEEIDYPQGKADHCIFVWLGGGAAHIDTWDPKSKGDGKKIPGSAYEAIDTAVPGLQV